ncbi:hypothetical protein NBRC10513v2_003563 [Rhodotorula toruloides]
MDRLANETLELILEYASTGVLLGRYTRPARGPAFHSRGLRMRWLASLQLVSRQFLQVVRSFAYNEVAVSSADQLELLTDHLDRNPDLALQPISLVIFASDPVMNGGTLVNGAAAWRGALLRFARCRPSIRGLEVYGPVDADDWWKWGVFDLSWVETFATALDRLLLANVVVAHDATIDRVQLSTLRTLVMCNYHVLVDPAAQPHLVLAAPTLRVNTAHQFLRRTCGIRHLELFDYTYLAADLTRSGPSFVHIPNLRTVTIEYQTLGRIEPRLREPFRLFGAKVEHLTVVNARTTIQIVDLHLEWYLDDISPLKTFTLVGTELFFQPRYRDRIQERLAAMTAGGKVVSAELRFLTLDEWIYERVDMAGLSWVAGQRRV